MASDAVAAGLGALTTCRLVGPVTSLKSSTRAPSVATAWARTPDGPKTSWSTADLGHVALQVAHERPLDDVAPDLAGAGAPPAASQAGEARVADRLDQVPQIHVAAAVALAGGGQHGVRAGPHVAVDALREVHAEERAATGSGTG